MVYVDRNQSLGSCILGMPSNGIGVVFPSGTQAEGLRRKASWCRSVSIPKTNPSTRSVSIKFQGGRSYNYPRHTLRHPVPRGNLDVRLVSGFHRSYYMYSGLSPESVHDMDEKVVFSPESPIPRAGKTRIWKDSEGALFFLKGIVDGNQDVWVFDPKTCCA